MTFIFGAAALLGAIGGVTGWALGRLLRRLPFDRRLSAFRIGLALPLVPFAFHAYWTYRFSVGWIDLEAGGQPSGPYTGAIAFALLSLGLGLSVLLFALFLSARVPLLTALYPAILFITYFNLALPVTRWRAPYDGVILDNMPNIWLFLLYFGATAMLATTAAVALPRSELNR